MGRFSRDCIVTEKIDGTNSQVCITEDGSVLAGSRSRWLTPENDNYGFAQWVEDHRDELKTSLGPGRHYGEWWGQKIQRSYGLLDRRFSLFNTERWNYAADEPKEIRQPNPTIVRMQEELPPCCDIVPVLWTGPFAEVNPDEILEELKYNGSSAVPGFMNPEGIIIYHVAGGVGFKKTIKDDDMPKSKVK